MQVGERSRMGSKAEMERGMDADSHNYFKSQSFLSFLPRNFGMPVRQTMTSLESDSYKIWLEKY